jgi:hypothetical protein
MWLVDSTVTVPSNIGKIGCNPKIFSTSKPLMFQMQCATLRGVACAPLQSLIPHVPDALEAVKIEDFLCRCDWKDNYWLHIAEDLGCPGFSCC